MKQKIVVWVAMNHDKCRSKALQIAVRVSGVEKVALTGQDRDHVEVEGDGIDSVELTGRLRKKVAHAVLVSVGEVNNPDPTPAPAATPTPAALAQPLVVVPPCCHGYPHYQWCEVVHSNMYGPSCTIL